MAKVFIEQDTLTAIGDAIRGKEGTTELVPVTDMATRITSLQTGSDPVIESLEITSNGTYTATDCDGYSPITVNVPQDGAPTAEELTITGNCQYRFTNNGWNWVIDKYGDKITTKDITSLSNAFNGCTNLEEIPLTLNISNLEDISSLMGDCSKLKQPPKVRGTFKWSTNTTFYEACTGCQHVRYLDDLFLPEMLDGFSTVKVTRSSLTIKAANFSKCYSLRRIPEWWYKFKLNPESTAFPSSTYLPYRSLANYCYSLDEVTNIPVWVCAAPQTSNMLGGSFTGCNRVKDVTFETNEDGTPKTANWKSQIIYCSDCGHSSSYAFKSYNSGITADKEVKDDATYQALKNDPDWFTVTGSAYSRYNKISAINTINSLPDTSAYLATAGGTNTISFRGAAGELTDGGAINTMTEEEIAVATAKGWTVTFS